MESNSDEQNAKDADDFGSHEADLGAFDDFLACKLKLSL
jgi:hypothetical protein